MDEQSREEILDLLSFVKDKVRVEEHRRGRKAGEVVTAFIELESGSDECLTFKDKKAWYNAYRTIRIYCQRHNHPYRVTQRSNSDGIHFHLWKTPCSRTMDI